MGDGFAILGSLGQRGEFFVRGFAKEHLIDLPVKSVEARIVRAKEGSILLFVVEPTEGGFSRQLGSSDFGRKSGFTNREEPILTGIWAKTLKGKSVVAGVRRLRVRHEETGLCVIPIERFDLQGATPGRKAGR